MCQAEAMTHRNKTAINFSRQRMSKRSIEKILILK